MSIQDYVSREFEILAQVIYEYDENLRLQMIPFSEHANLIDKSKVFRIVDISTNTIVMHADSLANPRDILARLWAGDASKHDPLALMDAQNAAEESLRLQKIIEDREAKKDFVAFIAKNTKSRWRHNGRVRDDEFRDLGPVSKPIT